ncbi:ABC transporter substrate-binding protein [Amycolatopsis rhabdoformis]|uniref:ABC transporter substrate-binding protein n=1 Tax=Amycolatopsis rhabdoformis TaxID=1448059 RepID=A0ABZ1IHK0_9PSEU|nr:ABC transporter substrate-binding protein [Amycolatopsis rhabdoformis]WSE33591.1 ABC transporter substrate-binding protein [Amycolatopsis rhabdoformis]
MPDRRHSLAVAALAGCFFAASCGAGAAADLPTPPSSAVAGGRPAPACPAPPVLTAPPNRIVTMDGGAAAIVVELGLGDRIVGTSATDYFVPFGPPERAKLDRIPVLDPRRASTEKVLDAHPDLAVGTSNLSFGGFDGTPSAEVLEKAGVKALAACQTQPAPVRGIDQTTKFVTEVAAALGVPEAGERLVRRIRADAGAPAREDEPAPVLVLTGVPAPGTPVSTRGGGTLVNGVVAAAGGRNLAEDVPAAFAGLSAEEIAVRDPRAIVVLSGFAQSSDADLLAGVRASPLLAGTTAVRENRIAVIPQSTALTPSVLTGQAVHAVAELLKRPAA